MSLCYNTISDPAGAVGIFAHRIRSSMFLITVLSWCVSAVCSVLAGLIHRCRQLTFAIFNSTRFQFSRSVYRLSANSLGWLSNSEKHQVCLQACIWLPKQTVCLFKKKGVCVCLQSSSKSARVGFSTDNPMLRQPVTCSRSKWPRLLEMSTKNKLYPLPFNIFTPCGSRGLKWTWWWQTGCSVVSDLCLAFGSLSCGSRLQASLAPAHVNTHVGCLFTCQHWFPFSPHSGQCVQIP